MSEQQPQAWSLPEEPGWDSSQVDRNQIAGNRRGHHGGLSMRLSFPICERTISLCAWALPSTVPGLRSELLSLAFAALTCRGSTPITSRQAYLVPSFCSAVPRTSRVVSCAIQAFSLPFPHSGPLYPMVPMHKLLLKLRNPTECHLPLETLPSETLPSCHTPHLTKPGIRLHCEVSERFKLSQGRNKVSAT